MRISREQMLMEMAYSASKRGTCGRLAVGAVIARASRPISLGYVGAPAGEPHCWEIRCDLNQPCTRTLHAEKNAIVFAKATGIIIQGADMYCTDSPCLDCAIEIAKAGIARFYYDRAYRLSIGLEHLLSQKVAVFQVLANGMINEMEPNA